MDRTQEQAPLPSIINLNVGGYFFTTRLSTLRKYEDSMLAAMFSERYKIEKDKDGNFFLDIDGTHFKHILNFLRNEQHLPPRQIAYEVMTIAMYLGINSLVERLKSLDHDWEGIRNSVPDYFEMKERIIILGESVDSRPDCPPSWRFQPHVILDFFVDEGVQIVYKNYEKCKKIFRPGRMEINCQTYMEAVDLAGCLYKDLLNDGYNVSIEELHPCIANACGSRSVSESDLSLVGQPEDEKYNNFRFLLVFNWNNQEVCHLDNI